MRRIASEVGYSTAVVTHYFANKNDLLLSAFRALGERNQVKFDECIARDPPDLLGFLDFAPTGAVPCGQHLICHNLHP